MMPTIEIDQDMHTYLLSRVKHFGESASDVLRRELGDRLLQPGSTQEAPASDHELADVLASPEFRHSRGVVGKFLCILGVAHDQLPDGFERVLSIHGRDRIYFAKSKREIQASGRSTQPRQVPGSPYWVMTNSPTHQKQEMLREVLSGLEYSARAIDAAADAIG